MVWRQGFENISGRQASTRLRNRCRRWHDQCRLRQKRGRIVRDGGEGSKGPTGERQHRKDKERKVASGKRACSSELPQRARRLNSNGAERRHAWLAFELSTSAEPS